MEATFFSVWPQRTNVVKSASSTWLNRLNYDLFSIFRLSSSIFDLSAAKCSFLQWPRLSIVHNMLNSIVPSIVSQNATAEDFLWYNIHLATLKPSTSFHSYISKLQRRILQAGPQHFGSGEDVVPGRRRIVLSQYSSSCTSLISFRLQNYPAAWTLLPTFSTQVSKQILIIWISRR